MENKGGDGGGSLFVGRTEDARLAIGFLTRLPTSAGLALAPRRLAAAAWAFPLAGLLVGGLAATLLLSLDRLGVPPLAALVLVLAFAAWFTRGLHEDGLADLADGIGAGDRARRLEIMRDSRIGTFGVLALVTAVLLRLASLAALPDARDAALALVAAAVLSRAAMVVLMASLPAARPDGLARHSGRPPGAVVASALILALALGLLALSWEIVLGAAVAVGTVTLALHLLARRRLGGRTGDVLGAAQQIGEAAFLLVLATIAT